MADDTGILAYVGIRVSAFFAGTAGGLVGVLFDDKASLKIWFTYALGGGLVSNFLLGDAMHFFPAWATSAGVGFALGVCAPVVVIGLKAAAKKWQSKFGGGA
jgi:hypothetical protein